MLTVEVRRESVKLHHHVKPHHHITLWILVIFQVVFALGVYADTTLIYAQEQSEVGPNEDSQAFFGAKVKKKTGSLPSECQMAAARSTPLNTDTFSSESSR